VGSQQILIAQESNELSNELFFTSIPPNFNYHTPLTQLYIPEQCNIPNLSLNKNFFSFFTPPKYIEQVFHFLFYQYEFGSIGFILKHQKTDIIFPFHNFW